MTASAALTSSVLLMRTALMAVTSFLAIPLAGPCGGQDSGPDGGIGDDEQHLAAGAAEGEVDRPGQADLANEIPGRAEHLHAGRRRDVNAAIPVHLDPVGKPGSRDREQPTGAEVAAAEHVEGDDMVRPADVVATRLVVGAAIGDIQGLLVGGEGQPVRLVETVGDDRQPAGPGIEAV